MIADDVSKFEQRLTVVLETYGKNAGIEVLKVWLRMLEHYPWRLIDEALDDHVRSSRWAPTPADIVAVLDTMDGRPTADEAWAIALQSTDEQRTIVWTEEIAEAMGLAQQVLDHGDRVAARRTFIDAYERRVHAARKMHHPAKWSVSLGQDPAQRRDALEQATIQGLIPHETARKLAPPDGPTSTADILSLAKHRRLLTETPKSKTEKNKNADHWRKISEMLKF